MIIIIIIYIFCHNLLLINLQVWLALFHLLMDENCQHKYELNNYRKNVILKVNTIFSLKEGEYYILTKGEPMSVSFFLSLCIFPDHS